FRKMRMIKTDHWNFQTPPDPNCSPAELIRIARFNDVGTFLLQNFADGREIDQRAITPPPRNEWRTDRVNTRTAMNFDRALLTRNDKHMLVIRCVLLNIVNLLVEITFHSTAQRRIKLS